MTHCNCPKTQPSAITAWQEHRYNHVSISAQSNASQTTYHYVFAFTPLYFSISTFTSFPTKTSVNLLMLQIDWSQSPPSLPDVNHVCGENHVLPQRTALQHLAMASGHGGGVFPFPIRLSRHIKHSLFTSPVAGSLSDVCTSTHCTTRTLLVWM